MAGFEERSGIAMIGEEVILPEQEDKLKPAYVVNELYLYVQRAPNGHESVVTVVEDNLIMPCLTASAKSLPKLREIAQKHADKTHSKVALLHFTNREEIEVLEENLVKIV